jgi:hypothetical protein
MRPSTGKARADSSGKARWIIAAVILLLLALAAWAFLPTTDPALARIQEIRQQLDDAPPEQRRELFGQMREEYRNLSDEDREQLRDEWRGRWEAREQKMLNDFFALSPAEQVARIDEQIKEDAQDERQRAERRARNGNGQGQAGNGGGNRGDRANRASRDSLERRKGYLDRTSPQTRAQRSEYRRLREQRRQQLGLPPRRR